jgi:hypothetical protein
MLAIADPYALLSALSQSQRTTSDMDMVRATTSVIASDTADFEVWCGCVQRLLGWAGDMHEDWPALFAAGLTPREAARTTIYGDDSSGD